MAFEGTIMAKRRLGQVFLVTPRFAEVEAAHADGKTVIEIGPGTGTLTKELCKSARKVIAFEKDRNLYIILKHELKASNLVLINKDFFDASDDELDLEHADIVISNIPYNLSSRVIEWLAYRRMQAVLCLQKEFVEHMTARPGTRSYSKLSVMSSLTFRITKIMDVPRGNFRPIPKVDSAIIYMKPLDREIGARSLELIGLMMQHKKKTVRNAILDSSRNLGIGRERLSAAADGIGGNGRRLFKLSPEEILGVADELGGLLVE